MQKGSRAIPTIDDYRWLVSDQAIRWLEQAQGADQALVARTAGLRSQLSQERVHLVLEQVELRRRARAKFTQAERMFFTPTGLEQATGQFLATYKAKRMPAGQPVADLCCGIGGDLVAQAKRGPVVGVDRDAMVAVLAEANCGALGLDKTRVRTANVSENDVRTVAAWHLDPDRRPHGRRTTGVRFHEPGPEVVDRLLVANRNACVKLSPAARLLADWERQSDPEWISDGHECKQLVLWFGDLSRHTGLRSATVLRHGDAPRTLLGSPDEPFGTSPSMGRYVFEPDPAVLAARLTGALATQHELAALEPGVAYLTGDRIVDDAALQCFEVSDVLPFDLRRLKAMLRRRRIGRLEVKLRSVDHDPAEIQRRLGVPGDGSATLLVTLRHKKQIAILGHRR